MKIALLLLCLTALAFAKTENAWQPGEPEMCGSISCGAYYNSSSYVFSRLICLDVVYACDYNNNVNLACNGDNNCANALNATSCTVDNVPCAQACTNAGKSHADVGSCHTYHSVACSPTCITRGYAKCICY
jgi:hypothetical protein